MAPLRRQTATCLPPLSAIATNTPPKALTRQLGGLFDSLVRPHKQATCKFFEKQQSTAHHVHKKAMRLVNKYIALGFAILLKYEAAFACPPPILPPDWKPPTWHQIVATAFERAQAVALIDVTNVNVSQTTTEHAPTVIASKGNYRSIKVYKGSIETLPNPFELERTSIDCDQRQILGETGMKIVFINAHGEINFAVYKGKSYQPTIDALEKIIR